MKVYVCSPLRANEHHSMEENIDKAKEYCRLMVMKHTHTPIAPHIYFTQFLDDNKDVERELGIRCGLELLEDCDELWVFGNYISDGMSREIQVAALDNKRIRFFDENGKER